MDFDRAIEILSNPTRREILKRLVREPHYPLQLSEHLDVSQQAIVKHLNVLEENGFVECEKVASERGGLRKKFTQFNNHLVFEWISDLTCLG